MDPATIAALIQAMASIGGGMLSSMGNKETPIQKQQRGAIDEILASMKGDGPYSDMFNVSDEAFQKSFIDPAKSIFQNQIAPGIQQNYIGMGQEGSSGMNDQLLRAGVDMDQLLNSQYMDFINQGMNRKSNAMGQVLGAGAGVAQNSPWQNAAQSAGGYLSSDAFSKSIGNMFNNQQQGNQFSTARQHPTPYRKGYVSDYYG